MDNGSMNGAGPGVDEKRPRLVKRGAKRTREISDAAQGAVADEQKARVLEATRRAVAGVMGVGEEELDKELARRDSNRAAEMVAKALEDADTASAAIRPTFGTC
jgi:hypothetical protein